MLDDLDDGRIPVAALAVVEEAVAADEKIFRAARGKGRGNRHRLSPLVAGTAAIGEVDAAQACEFGMLVLVGNLDAKIAAARVEIERAGLKDSLSSARVKILERDEIVE